MSGKARRKVGLLVGPRARPEQTAAVTSGRLAGKAKENREPEPSGPEPAEPEPPPRPKPDYSLYSTDSEEQVSSLSRGLDQCAALLSGILQADGAAQTGPQRTQTRQVEPRRSALRGQTGVTRAMKEGGAKPRATQGRTACRKPPRRAADLQGSEAATHRTSPARPRPILRRHQNLSRGHGADAVPKPGQDPFSCSVGTEAESVQNLLEELRTLIAGRGSVAERLLVRLERSLGQNPPFCRCGTDQNQKVEEPQNQEERLTSGEAELQKQLLLAQSRLQELQDDLAELRKALQDTRSQLRDSEAEKGLMRTELEAARKRLLESEREQSELASLAQQRLQEVEELRRLLPARGPSDHQNSPRFSPAAASGEHIQRYLASLTQAEPRNLRVAAERDGTGSEAPESWSNWSRRSESSFNTRDEAAFRDGLAALDASIASLQRTIQLDLRK
ncbi:uncharacterized protein ccdc14 isoform X2 [Cyprinodon tularosa]|uniref:uncharacterized protein ccdc14 isoform X2 n=1 Tax=Cyprinodon tularosa TaxID=77115 RepID=UPI0018E2820E|nr:uncharacterized protein ccdc14 isoform X2 [Cyprinodon tularosa]